MLFHLWNMCYTFTLALPVVCVQSSFIIIIVVALIVVVEEKICISILLCILH
jgi:hypothetical protein